jgi:hypothetical protein
MRFTLRVRPVEFSTFPSYNRPAEMRTPILLVAITLLSTAHAAAEEAIVFENDRFRVYRTDHAVVRAYATDRRDGGGDREPLAVTERSPASLRVEGSPLGYAAVAHSQVVAGTGWHYDGERAVAHADGVRPVYPADEADGEFYGDLLGKFE